MQRLHRDKRREQRLSRGKSKPFSESRPLSVISPRDCHITLMKRGALDALEEGDGQSLRHKTPLAGHGRHL